MQEGWSSPQWQDQKDRVAMGEICSYQIWGVGGRGKATKFLRWLAGYQEKSLSWNPTQRYLPRGLQGRENAREQSSAEGGASDTRTQKHSESQHLQTEGVNSQIMKYVQVGLSPFSSREAREVREEPEH